MFCVSRFAFHVLLKETRQTYSSASASENRLENDQRVNVSVIEQPTEVAAYPVACSCACVHEKSVNNGNILLVPYERFFFFAYFYIDNDFSEYWKSA